MIDALNPYPAYKPSGVEWLGDVPAHWEISALRRKLRAYDGIKIGPFGSQLKLEQMSPSGYKVYGQANVIARDFARGTKFVGQEKFNELSACVVLPGDLLVTMMGTSGRCAYVPDDAVMGIMDSHLLRLRINANLDVKFASLLIDESPYVKDQIATAGKGSIMHGLNSSIVKDLALALPPLPEQTAIVRFLDHAHRRIRRYIRAKQKLIALLEEQKQAIIHQAVTGQIDVRTGQPYPAYQPSGVEWLGDVPAHWEVAALRLRYSQCLGKMLDSKRITGNHSLPYLRNVDVQWDQINIEDLPTMDIAPDEYDRYTLREGDLLVCEGGEVGRCALWSGELFRCGFQKALHRLRPLNAGQDVPRFMHYVLRAAVKGNAFNDGHLSTIAHLTGDKLRAHHFPFPPASEQESLVAFLDAVLKQVDRAISRVGRQIDLVQEYHTRLIADVVTGKLDVRKEIACCET